jgi:hypothetical protein
MESSYRKMPVSSDCTWPEPERSGRSIHLPRKADRTQLIEVIKEVAVIRVRYDYRHPQVLLQRERSRLNIERSYRPCPGKGMELHNKTLEHGSSRSLARIDSPTRARPRCTSWPPFMTIRDWQ